MDSLIDNVGLLCMIVNGGQSNKIVGRTKLQKISYFCRYLGWDVEDYRLHYYGPFSSKLASVLNEAKSANLITESGGMPYEYEISNNGQVFLAKFIDKVCNHEKVSNTQTLIKELSGWSKDNLELAATIDFVYRNNPKLSKIKLLDKVAEIKENFSRHSIENAYEHWQKLKNRLAKLSK